MTVGEALYQNDFLIYCLLFLLPTNAVISGFELTKRHHEKKEDSTRKTDFFLDAFGLLFSLSGPLIVFVVLFFSSSETLKTISFVIFLLCDLFFFKDGIRKSIISVETDDKDFSIDDKENILFVSQALLSLTSQSFFRKIPLSGEGEVILVRAFSTFNLLCYVLFLFVFVVRAIAKYFFSKSVGEKVKTFGENLLNSKIEQKVFSLYLYEKNSNLHWILRVIIVAACFVGTIVASILFIVQILLANIIFIFSTILMTIEKMHQFSDTKLIWLAVRIAIMLSLIFTEQFVLRSPVISQEAGNIYEYISGAILIPLVLEEVLRFSSVFSKRDYIEKKETTKKTVETVQNQ